MHLQVRVSGLLQAIGVGNHVAAQDASSTDYHEVAVPFTLRRRGVETRLIVGDHPQPKAVDPVLVSTLANAHAWFHELASGTKASVNDIAHEQGLAANEISRLLRLAFLAPDIVEAILVGRQPLELNTKHLKRFEKLPLDWGQQRKALGFPSAAIS